MALHYFLIASTPQLARLRGLSRHAYNSPITQTFFALVIIASFMASCIDAEVHPAPGSWLEVMSLNPKTLTLPQFVA